MIDYTVGVGNLIQIVAFVATAIYGIAVLRGTVGTLKSDMVEVKDELKKVAEVLKELAVTNKRLDYLEEDLRELKHGEGFVLPLGGRMRMPEK